MKTEEVKPCPACGGPPEYAGDAEGTEFWIACGCLRSCRMGGPTRKTMAEAVAAWNALPRRSDAEETHRITEYSALKACHLSANSNSTMPEGADE